MPPAGCNTAITPIGKRSASTARRIGWRKLVAALPKIRRHVSMHLSGDEPTREFALSAVIELIARTAIRPGNESYARLNGTRGATTLLKSNVTLEDDCVVLTFKAKGGKAVRKECDAAKLVRAIGILRSVPGKRMFQYRDASGIVRAVSTTTVNAFLREIAGIKISLKDFRTLMASAVVLESLSRISPAASARGRKRQVLDAVRAAADELSNTPAICRKSYVHDTIVTAFEDGILERFAATMKGYRTQKKREQLLAQVVTGGGGVSTAYAIPEHSNFNQRWMRRVTSRARNARGEGENTAPRSRGADSRPSCLQEIVPPNREGAGNAGRTRTRSLACKMKKAHEQSHHRFAGNIPAFPAQWFYGFLRALPGDRACLSPSPARSSASQNLTPASGCQDHTTSPSAQHHSSRAFVLCADASTASRTQRL